MYGRTGPPTSGLATPRRIPANPRGYWHLRDARDARDDAPQRELGGATTAIGAYRSAAASCHDAAIGAATGRRDLRHGE